MKRVLIISYYWPPSGGSGVQRWLKFSKFLPEFGWEPVILTVDPKKATYPVLDESLLAEVDPELTVVHTDSKEWFSFYKKTSGSEKIPYAGFANESKSASFKQKVARFVRGNFFLPDPRKGWNESALEAARTILKDKEIDCIITTSPPHSTQLIGYKLAKENKIPWIADFRDPWTDIYYYKQFYPTRIAHRYNVRMERMILEKSSLVITISHALRDLFGGKIKSSQDKIKVISNGYDPEDFHNLPEPPRNKKFTLTYVGTIGDIQPIDEILNAFQRFAEIHDDVVLRFIGSVSPEHRKKIAALPEKNIEIIPYVEHRLAIEYMSSSTALLLIIPTSPEFNKGLVSGKIFEYMAVKRPILLIGPKDGDAANMIKEGNAGIAIESKNQELILETLLKWHLKIPSVEVNTRYDRKTLTKSLARIMDDLI